jgi:hypothetical protein
VSSQKIHIGGDVCEEDCDSVVVTTLADLFDAGKVKATSRSAQLIGLMEDDVLRDISKDRYDSLETTFIYPIHQEKIDDRGT